MTEALHATECVACKLLSPPAAAWRIKLNNITQLIPPEVEAVPVEYRAGVAVQLLALRVQARLVEEFALPDELTPAPVFTP